CAACARRIETRLSSVEGVHSATVNLVTELAAVDFDPRVVSTSDLLAAVSASGYTATPRGVPDADAAHLGHAGHSADNDARASRTKVWVASALTVPLLLISMVPTLQFDGWRWVAAGLATPVVFWAGAQFHLAAVRAARHGASSMDTLVSLGTLAAWCWSVAALTVVDGHLYFEIAATVTTLLLVGRSLEARAKREAGAALRALGELSVREASVIDVNTKVERLTPIEQVDVGDRVAVRPGERIAVDGIIEQGSSSVDRSVITGESAPEDVTIGAAVTGGTINLSGRLVVRATRVGTDATLARIARLVHDAQSGRAEVQRLADRVSAVFVPAVLVIALATLIAWLLAGGSTADAFTASIAVLVVACPCALGLATPTALLVGSGRGAQLGLLIKGPEVLESSRRIDTVVLDKTGTLTTGVMSVIDVFAVEARHEH
ncbi:MAG: carbonate dehydratase, partial [Thermoleophilia bacterium]|nr:carbonate dehydratase [Thermoleophilia bacterium]